MKTWKKLFIIAAIAIAVFLVIYPNIEFDTGEKIIKCSYTGDFSEFEKNQSYDERYCYNEERDISIYTFDVDNFLFFYVISMEYEDGDMRETQFVLEETYIRNFLENAEIEYNDNNINIAELIEGKEAIVGNTRYLGNDYNNAIYYILDGWHEVLYVFYVDDLLVIQVGNSDEGPRYIAYK